MDGVTVWVDVGTDWRTMYSGPCIAGDGCVDGGWRMGRAHPCLLTTN
jgi:hypothetical protein